MPWADPQTDNISRDPEMKDACIACMWKQTV